MVLVDLSHKIESNMPVYPGDLKVSIEKEDTLENDGFNSYIMKSGFHCGTHIDAPMHMTESHMFIGDYSTERFCGPAVLLDVRGESVISLKEEYSEKINRNDIVLFYTGWDRFYGEDGYYEDHPVLSE